MLLLSQCDAYERMRTSSSSSHALFTRSRGVGSGDPAGEAGGVLAPCGAPDAAHPQALSPHLISGGTSTRIAAAATAIAFARACASAALEIGARKEAMTSAARSEEIVACGAMKSFDQIFFRQNAVHREILKSVVPVEFNESRVEVRNPYRERKLKKTA